MLRLVVTTIATMIFSQSLLAQNKCIDLFKSEAIEVRYKASDEDVAILYSAYPKYMEMIEKTVANIEARNLNPNVTPISKITEIKNVRGADSGTDWGKPAQLDALPASLKKQIVDTHNLLLKKEELKEYMIELLNDTGVLMMKEKDRETFGLSNMAVPTSARTTEKVKKEEYLLNGIADRNSMLRVLVNRVRARGDSVAVILDGGKGGYESNQTKTQKYTDFWGVPKRGPFFDRYFGAGSSHGQEGHLLQMDFVEKALKPSNRRQYWDYVTSAPKGSWLWDTLYDGMNNTYMHPEFIGPLLRSTIPLY